MNATAKRHGLPGRDPVVERFALTRNAAYRTRYLINAYPTLYMPLVRLWHRQSKNYYVEPGTEIVIEGFGRAGSTFARMAFESAQNRPVHSAHHTHAAAQVITAVELSVPTLVIVRPPLDAALSHMARHGITAHNALVAWTRFHRRIVPHAHGFVVCSFGELTTNFGAAIERVNHRFGTSFAVFDHTPENELLIFERIRERNRRRFGDAPSADRAKALALPTPEREELKGTLKADLQRDDLADLRHRAAGLYSTLVEQHDPAGESTGSHAALETGTVDHS
jgi:hypothetical protein